MGKGPACQRKRNKRCKFDPGLGRSPGRRNGNPLQYSCLENPMGREAWRATVHGVVKSQTQLSDARTHILGPRPHPSALCLQPHTPSPCGSVSSPPFMGTHSLYMGPTLNPGWSHRDIHNWITSAKSDFHGDQGWDVDSSTLLCVEEGTQNLLRDGGADPKVQGALSSGAVSGMASPSG